MFAPCLPTKTDKLPSDGQWLHEIKHDGFRVIARKKSAQVRLYSRPGNDLTHRFPLIVEGFNVRSGPLCGLKSDICPVREVP
jgi:bifunctional non-homologous end joining protein LigD